ncbi:DUF3842 family protein [uncultured Clostridium sp.]|uniref:DUF3842 family protein n=1 Tax=uncultured Clostridium sp. TaxID=59620 RepID=UPI00261C4FF2|nr:DUF3842 family protein [uncultured Clostridium sp.]
MRIGVIDGQGGGFGKVIVERLRKEFDEEIQIIALGTNSAATTLMLRAGANEGATGENAIIYNSNKVEIILGPIGIICANSLLGELTPSIAKAISESGAKKILLPLNRSNIFIVGIETKPLPHYIDDLVKIVREEIEKNV